MKEISDNAINAFRVLENELVDLKRRMLSILDDNDKIGKAAAIAKCGLEKALKNPSVLNDSVYEAINILRTVTPYTKDSGRTSSIDPPLTESEKTLPKD